MFCDIAAEFEVKDNFACKDPNQQVLRDMSEENCQSQCRCSDGCNGYTYNANRRDCYLKESCNQGEWHPDDKSGLKIEVAYPQWPKTPPTASPSPPPVVNPPKGCNSQGLPFGLDNVSVFASLPSCLATPPKDC